MGYGDYPARASPEDLLKVCQSLREGGKTEEEIEGDDDLDVGRDTVLYGIYLGFIEDSEEGELTLTDRGTQLGYRDDLSEATESLFLEGVKQYMFYADLTDHLINKKEMTGSIEQKEVLPELRTKFEIRDLSDDIVKRITRAYLKTLGCAGFGEFLIGRRGSATRIEFNEDITGLVSTVTSSESASEPENEATEEVEDGDEGEDKEEVGKPQTPEMSQDENEESDPASAPNVKFDRQVDGTKVKINIDISSEHWESEEVIKFLNELRETAD